jgi:hypothetical protein
MRLLLIGVNIRIPTYFIFSVNLVGLLPLGLILPMSRAKGSTAKSADIRTGIELDVKV